MQPSENGHKAPARIMPRCPHCGAGKETGAPLVAIPLDMGNMHCILIYCGNAECGAIHTVNVMTVAMPAPEPNLIAVPGRDM